MLGIVNVSKKLSTLLAVYCPAAFLLSLAVCRCHHMQPTSGPSLRVWRKVTEGHKHSSLKWRLPYNNAGVFVW